MLKLGRTKSQTLSTEALSLPYLFFRDVCWMGLNLQSAKNIRDLNSYFSLGDV